MSKRLLVIVVSALLCGCRTADLTDQAQVSLSQRDAEVIEACVRWEAAEISRGDPDIGRRYAHFPWFLTCQKPGSAFTTNPTTLPSWFHRRLEDNGIFHFRPASEVVFLPVSQVPAQAAHLPDTTGYYERGALAQGCLVTFVLNWKSDTEVIVSEDWFVGPKGNTLKEIEFVKKDDRWTFSRENLVLCEELPHAPSAGITMRGSIGCDLEDMRNSRNAWNFGFFETVWELLKPFIF